MQSNSFCTVIIVTHNSEPHLPKAMECLAAQTHPASQILLVDSGSTHTGYLQQFDGVNNAQVIIGEKGIGFCKGNNLGWSQLGPDSEYVFFLNPDAFLTPKFLEDAIAFMRQNPDCGALTGTTLGYDIHADKPTGQYDTTGVFRTWYGRWYDRAQGHQVEPSRYAQNESLPAICGAVFFCRKKALEEVLIRGCEVFDSTFFMYKEDIDLSLRLRHAGWKLMFVPHLAAYHCRGWNRDRKKVPRAMRLHSALNDLRVNARMKSMPGMLYSGIKYSSVKLFDL